MNRSSINGGSDVVLAISDFTQSASNLDGPRLKNFSIGDRLDLPSLFIGLRTDFYIDLFSNFQLCYSSVGLVV